MSGFDLQAEVKPVLSGDGVCTVPADTQNCYCDIGIGK